MTESPIYPVFVLLVAATVLWLALIWRLFALLKSRARDVYASLGQPHIILNNTPVNNLAFLRFLLGGHFRSLGDEGIRRLCHFLQVFFWCYLAVVVGLAIAMLAGVA
jgi:hypothetical protein